MSAAATALGSLRKGLRPVLDLRRAVALVWTSAPWWSLASVLLLLVQGVLPLLLLHVVKLLIDGVAAAGGPPGSGSATANVGMLLGAAAGIGVLQTLAGVAGRLVGDAQAQAVSDHMYDVLHAKSVEVDLEYYEDTRYRNSLHRAQQQAPYRPARIVSGLLEVGRNGVSLAVMAGLLWSFHWSVVPVLLAVSLPGLVLRLRHAATLHSWERARTPAERLTYYFNQLLTSVRYAKEVRLYDLAALFQDRFSVVRRQLRRERVAITARRSVGEFLGESIAVVGMFAVLGGMAGQALRGAISLGGLVMYYQALQRGWGHFGQMLRSVSGLYEDNLFLAEVYELLDLRPRVVDAPNPRPVPRPLRAGLSWSHVSFRYPGSPHPVLEDVTFEIGAGEHVAFVGPNGSGKTTLVKLLCRLYDPTQGVIRMDGVDLRHLAVRALRRQYAVLVQDFARYEETARENIRLGNLDLAATDEHITDAARRTHAHDVIARLPRGYDTVLGNMFEGAHELSAGQWQRLALARVLVRPAQILVLDEPTSALDAEAEHAVLEGVRKLAQERTTIVISHRLAAVRPADRIFVLDQGRLVESGRHEDLLRRGGTYARLFERQAEDTR